MHDVIIIGAGPAGVSAAVYAKRYNLEVLVIEKDMILGGKVLYPHWIENFIGIPEGISGVQLSEQLAKHLTLLDVSVINGQVASLQRENEVFKVVLASGTSYPSKTVILAHGTRERMLNIPGEIEYKGKGVSYCATCDAPFFKNKTIAVIGGGDSALAETLYLAEFASNIHLIHRRTELRGAELLSSKLLEHPKITPWLGYQATSISGNQEKLESIHMISNDQKNKKVLPVDGIFIFAGYEPDTHFISESLSLDEKGFIVTNEEMLTSLQGLYAAGDIRSKHLRQIITALSDGAIAAYSIREQLKA